MSICTSSFTRSSHFELVIMKRRPFRDVVRGLIFIQIFLTSVCVGLSPCIPESDPLGRYTVRSESGNIWTEGIPSGSIVQVHVRCDQGAIAQPSVTSHCSNGTWITTWPRCEKPCSVPVNRGDVRQFVNGLASMPVDSYTRPTLPDGTHIVARCHDPGKARFIGDQRRTCHGGLWTGEEPQCEPVETKVLFNGAPRQVASNGTVEVYVYREDPRRLYVICKITRWRLRPPRLTTPLVNDRDLPHSHSWYSHKKQLDPITTEYSGTYTCSGSSKSHSVHVVFKAAECEAPAAPDHGRLVHGYRQQPRDIIPSDTTIYFACEDGYRLVGSRWTTCIKGEWSHLPPTCKVSRCPALTIPDHAVMEGVYGYGRNIGDERIFYCREGYVLRGDTNNLRCLEGGVWSDPLPTCEAVVHHVSPCEGVHCESWERCVVTGPSTSVCGCINPSSCLTSGPTVCGSNGLYYRSECHLRARACLIEPGLDVAEDDIVCIYGVPDEDPSPTQATEDNNPVDYSSSSSFEVYENPPSVQDVPAEPPTESQSPSQAEEDTDSLDYSSFSSFDMVDPISSFGSIAETSNSTPVNSTHNQPTSKAYSPGEGLNETTRLTPTGSTAFSRPTNDVTTQSSNSSAASPIPGANAESTN